MHPAGERLAEKSKLVEAARALLPARLRKTGPVTIVYGDGTTEVVLAKWNTQTQAGAFSCEREIPPAATLSYQIKLARGPAVLKT